MRRRYCAVPEHRWKPANSRRALRPISSTAILGCQYAGSGRGESWTEAPAMTSADRLNRPPDRPTSGLFPHCRRQPLKNWSDSQVNETQLQCCVLCVPHVLRSCDLELLSFRSQIIAIPRYHNMITFAPIIFDVCHAERHKQTDRGYIYSYSRAVIRGRGNNVRSAIVTTCSVDSVDFIVFFCMPVVTTCKPWHDLFLCCHCIKPNK